MFWDVVASLRTVNAMLVIIAPDLVLKFVTGSSISMFCELFL